MTWPVILVLASLKNINWCRVYFRRDDFFSTKSINFDLNGTPIGNMNGDVRKVAKQLIIFSIQIKVIDR